MKRPLASCAVALALLAATSAVAGSPAAAAHDAAPRPRIAAPAAMSPAGVVRARAAPAGVGSAGALRRPPVRPVAPRRVQWQAPVRNVFAPRSIWRVPVAKARLDPHSAAMVGQLTHQVAEYYGGTAALNVWQYNVSFVSVPRTQPRVDMRWDNCQNKDYTPAGLTGPGGVLTGVPIPARAHAAAGTDGELTLYAAATDQLWEFWQAKKDAAGHWSACWGGRIDHASTSRGWFDNGFGASASGLAIAGGMLSLADVRRGHVDHALSLAIPDPAPWDHVSWPAQRSDGSPASKSLIAEGTRFRLSAKVDLRRLHLTPIALMIARAAQRYGFVVTDMSGCVAVSAESGTNVKAATGHNPWVAALGGVPDYLQLKDFPWASLQALPKDWGHRGR